MSMEGMEYIFSTEVSIKDIADQFDAIVLATGKLTEQLAIELDIKKDAQTLAVNKRTGQYGNTNIFAAGCIIRKHQKLAIRSIADGKKVALSLNAWLLTGEAITKANDIPFNSRMGTLMENEMDTFMPQADKASRISPDTDLANTDAYKTEAQRCLHCDCRSADNCSLRNCAQQYSASITGYPGNRPLFTQLPDDPESIIIYEPGKCIKCGICTQITQSSLEHTGLAFTSRGYGVYISTPFDMPLTKALGQNVEKCILACPTGAMSFRNEPGKKRCPDAQ